MQATATLRRSRRPLGKTDRAGELSTDFLLRLLDEIDYGLVLVNVQGVIQHANHLARHELATGQLLGAAPDHTIIGCVAGLTEQLMAAVHGAARGRRRLLYLSHGEHALPMAVIPLAQSLEDGSASVLLVMARQRAGDNLVLQMFAHEHGLTPTEESVLRALCNGCEVDAIALRHGVAESTVRTQVRSLREKTGAHGIRQLVQHVLALPPVVPALRGSQPKHAGPASLHLV